MRLFKDQLFKPGENRKALRLSRKRVRLEDEQPMRTHKKMRVRLSEPSHPKQVRRRKNFGKPLDADQLRLMQTCPNDIYLTTQQAAWLLGVSPKTLQNWRVRGIGPTFKQFQRMVRYLYADLKQWASKRDRSSTADPA